MFVILGFFVVFAVLGSSQAALSDEYTNNQRLDGKNESDPTYTLYWTYNKADSTISFAAKAKTHGWVGLGFTSKIDNTTTYDVVRGFHDELIGNKEIFDFHAVGKETPVKDTQQNLMNTSLSQNGVYTTMKFTRALDTKDPNDTVIEPGPMIVVWSVGNIDVHLSGYKDMGYKTVTLIPLEEKKDEIRKEKNNNNTATITVTNTPTASTAAKTSCSAGTSIPCQNCWLLLALSALLFLLPELRS